MNKIKMLMLAGLISLSLTANAESYKEINHGTTTMEVAYICHTKQDYIKAMDAVMSTDLPTLDRLILQGYCWYLPQGTKYILLQKDLDLDGAFIITKRPGDPIALEGWTRDYFK